MRHRRLANKKPRARSWAGKWRAPRWKPRFPSAATPFLLRKWKDFGKEIDRSFEELSHLDRELKKDGSARRTRRLQQRDSRVEDAKSAKHETTAGRFHYPS